MSVTAVRAQGQTPPRKPSAGASAKASGESPPMLGEESFPTLSAEDLPDRIIDSPPEEAPERTPEELPDETIESLPEDVPDKIIESAPEEAEPPELSAEPPAAPTSESRARLRAIYTDLGPVLRLNGSSFETIRAAKTDKKAGTLEFSGPGATANAAFDLPDTEDYAVSLVGRGLGTVVLELAGTEIHVPSQAEGASRGRRVVYAATESLSASGNSLSIRGGASGGVLDAVVFSRPLAKLRHLAARYASLEARRRILSDILKGEKADAPALARAPDPQLAKNVEILAGPLAGYLHDWRREYLAVYREYTKVYSGERPQPLGQRAVALAERLNGIEKQLASIREKYAPTAALDADNYRIPMQEFLRRETFAEYPWIALRILQIDSGADSLNLLKSLGIDAVTADLAVAGESRILERLEAAGLWCILSRDAPFRPEWNRGRDFDPDRTTSQPLPDLWRSSYLPEFDAYVSETYSGFGEHRAVLGFSYWPHAQLDLTVRDAESARAYPALAGAWDLFQMNAPTGSAAPAPPAREIDATTGTLSSASARGGLEVSALGEELAWSRFLEQTLAEHFRGFNRSLAAVAGNKPRLGLFASPFLGPGAASRGGLDGYELLADAGFPAFGMVMQGNPSRMAYADSLSRFDPARRPVWESLYRLDAPTSSSLSADGERTRIGLRRDFLRMAFWGVDGAVLDPGPSGAGLFEGPCEAALASEPVLEIPVLKRSMLILSQILRNSRAATQQIALLESGVDARRAGGGHYASVDPWLKWFKKERYAPIWAPRGVLAQDEPSAATARSLFDGCRILVSPGTLVLSETAASRLLRWVTDGGILFTTDPVGYVSPEGRTMPLFLEALGGNCVAGAPGHWTIRRGATLPPTVQILGTDAYGVPNVLLVPVGKGNLLVALGDVAGTATWAQLMSRTALFVFPAPLVRAGVGADELELLVRENDRGERFLLALNPDASRTVSTQVEVRGKYSAIVDLTHNRPVPVRSEALANGATRLELHLEPGEARVLRLQAPKATPSS